MTTPEQAGANAKRIQREDRNCVKVITERLMADKVGRRYVWLQLGFAQIFLGNDNVEPGYMAFEKGRRNTGLKLLSEIQHFTPHLYVKMLEENASAGAQLKEPEDDRDPDTSADA